METTLNDILLVERLDGSPAIVVAPYLEGAEGSMIVFEGPDGEEIGSVVKRGYASPDTYIFDMLSAVTPIYEAKKIYRLHWEQEADHGE